MKWKNYQKISKLLLCLFLFFINILSAQQKSKVTNIKGTSLIVGDVSPNQAKIEALNDAKINALKKAGIVENINSNQLLFTSQKQNDYSQFFTSVIQSEMQGAIESYEIKSERINCLNDNEIIYEASIDATVIKYDSKPDVSFDANIEGIKSVYNNDEKLSFDVTTTQTSYLTIFNITDKEAFVIYPNLYEKQMKLTQTSSYKFPIEKIDYTLHTDLKIQETNRLIFVFTKKSIQFIKMDKDQNTTNENIFSWIYSITPDQRKIEYFTLSIQK